MEYRGGAEEDYGVRSTEDREDNKGDWLAGVWSIGEVKGDSAKVQNGAELLCKGGKVDAEYRLQSTEDGVRSAGGARVVRSRFGRYLANGRDAVAPLPAGGGKGSGNGA